MLEYNFFDKIKLVVFDLDGTIYFGDELAQKADIVIEKLIALNKKICFVTNNSAKTREQITDKLTALGIKVQIDNVITSGYVIAKYLLEKKHHKVYCIGTNYLKEELLHNGIELNSATPTAVVVGYNKEFKLDDLNELCNMDLKKYELIIANKERIYPSTGGVLLPGAATIVTAVEAVLNHKADIMLGKPNPYMLKLAASRHNINPNNICVIGDSYESDIMMANNYGTKSILISAKKYPNTNRILKLADILENLK